MAFLTVAGVALDVREDGAEQLEPDTGGVDSRAWNGAARSTRRWVKRRWRFTTRPMTLAEVQALDAALGLGANVACAGDALGGVALTCHVTSGARPLAPDALGQRWTLALTLSEV